MIKCIEDKCPQSKVFFSPWLKARAKILKSCKTIKENKEAQQQIIDGYKAAYNQGINFAGGYMLQFILEAVMVNQYIYPNKKINDLYNYGYAIKYFLDKNMPRLIKDANDLIDEMFRLQHSAANPIWLDIEGYFPDLGQFNFKNKIIKKTEFGWNLENRENK